VKYWEIIADNLSKAGWNWITTFTAVLAIAAVIQLIIYGFQARYMYRGLNLTKQSAEAAKESAEAATTALGFAEQTQRITERAVVLVQSVIATNLGGDGLGLGALGETTAVVFTLKNFGRTIAQSVTFTGALTGAGHWPIEESPPIIIAPQGDNSWNSKSLGTWLNKQTIDEVNSGKLWLGYKIDVIYFDIFGVTHKYHCEGRYERGMQRFVTTQSREV
jgi:hypothetical protein